MRIGFIGLGSMGFPMAGHILARAEPGDQLTVNDMDAGRVAELVGRGQDRPRMPARSPRPATSSS